MGLVGVFFYTLTFIILQFLRCLFQALVHLSVVMVNGSSAQSFTVSLARVPASSQSGFLDVLRRYRRFFFCAINM